MSKEGGAGCHMVQYALMAAFSDVSRQSETSLSSPRIDNPRNDESGVRLGRVYTLIVFIVYVLINLFR